MAIVTLLRHGEVDGQPAFYGHTDIALSEQGQRSLATAIATIHSQLTVDCIVSSPLIRCATAAQTFAQSEQIPLQWEARFKEMHFGDWDGIAFAQLSDRWQQLEAFWQAPAVTAPPGGETLEQFAQRVIQAWQTLVQQPSSQHYLLICHGGVIRIILAHILQIDWRNASWFKQLHIDYSSNSRIDLGQHPGAQAQVKWIGLR